MSLLKLPTELLHLIAAKLLDRHVFCLLQVNRHLYSLLLPCLYQRRPKHEFGWPGNFMRAIATGNEQGTRNFLDYGADANIACGNCYLRVAKVSISPWFDMQTPLNIAASIGNDALVVLLLDHGAAINGVVQHRQHTQPAVLDAILSGHESIVRLLLERASNLQGPHIESGGLVNYAVVTGQLAMLKLLTEFGVDMNTPDHSIYPLYKAVCSTRLSTDIARFLLDHGAEIAHIDDGHGGLMEMVMQNGIIDTARLLLERGAIYPPDGFLSAVFSGSLDFMRLLIEYGMKPDIDSLIKAIRNQRFDMLQLLLEVLLEDGFDLNTKDSRGSTIMHYAVNQCGFKWPTQSTTGGFVCHFQALSQLVRDIEVISPQNVSAPCSKQGVQRDDAESILRYLIHIGADVNAMDAQGETPLYQARKYARPVEQILLDNGAISEKSSKR